MSRQTKETKDSSLQSAEDRMATEKVSGLLYLCNPLENTECRKTCCFFYGWMSHDNNVEYPCYKTCFEEYAARNANGEPIVWPFGTATDEEAIKIKYLEIRRKRNDREF